MSEFVTSIGWDMVEAIGTWFGFVAAVVAVFVALYVNYDAKSPQVVAYLEYDRDHNGIFLFISNFGDGVARNVRMTGFDASVVKSELRAVVETSFIATGIPVLVPGASRSTLLSGGAAIQDCLDKTTNVMVSYDMKRFLFGTKRVGEEFVLDYRSFAGSVYTTSDMHDIKYAVKQIERALTHELRPLRRAIERINEKLPEQDNAGMFDGL